MVCVTVELCSPCRSTEKSIDKQYSIERKSKYSPRPVGSGTTLAIAVPQCRDKTRTEINNGQKKIKGEAEGSTE